METALLSEHHVRLRTLQLNLHTSKLRRNGSKQELRGHPTDVLRVQQADDFRLALFEGLALDGMPKETTQD